MAEKDVTQKILEAHNDVFADIANTLLFDGKPILKENELEDKFAITDYESNASLYSMERDVSKLWKHGSINIACIGIENQSSKDMNMPLRVIAYDGAEYRKQANTESAQDLHPVITLVLYFGQQRWDKPRCLLDRIKVIPELQPYVSDYKINVFDISHMSVEEANKFQSDFKAIADYYAQVHENGIYKATKMKLNHPLETLGMFKALIGTKQLNDLILDNEGGITTMYDAFQIEYDKGVAHGEARGRAIGEARGKAIGEAHGKELYAKLTKKLIQLGRTNDLLLAADDISYREALMKELAIQ